jgi:hypothetical protein
MSTRQKKPAPAAGKPSNIPILEDVLLDRKSLAKRWHCSTETIKRREAEGVLKATKLGGRLVRYRLSDIQALESESMV